MKKTAWIVLFLLSFLLETQAQVSVDHVLSGMSEAQSKAYLKPLPDLFTYGMETNLYPKPSTRTGFYLYIGMQATVIPILDSELSSTINVGGQDISLTSIVGSNEETSITIDGERRQHPGGLALNTMQIYIPQLRIGTVAGIDIGLRYADYDYGQFLGKIKMRGININYGIDRMWSAENIALSIAAAYNDWEISNNLNGRSYSLRLNGGYQSETFHLHGFAGYISGKLDFEGQDAFTLEKYNYSLSTTENIAAGLGAGVQIWKILLHTEWTIHPRLTYGFGLGVSI